MIPFSGSPRRRTPPRPRRQQLSLRKPNSKSNANFFFVLAALFAVILVSWIFIMFISPWPPRHPSPMISSTQPHFRHGKKDGDGGGGRSLHRKGRDSWQPRVVGFYAYQLKELDGWKEGRNTINLPPYIYLTEIIDPYLLSHTSQTLRRLRNHNYYHREDASLTDVLHNYNLAIAGSTLQLDTEDPLNNLWLSSESRDALQNIRDDSEDYEDALAEPLEDEDCEATPQNRKWMEHSFPTCNFMHEFDWTNSLRRDKTKILGHGYWRDVWPVLDTEPASRSRLKKVALKTIRYEHDYNERNFHRHIRDAIVSERLTPSPLVTSIYSFCGNSGYFEFASEGSLADRLEEHYYAKMDDKSEENRNNPDEDEEKILDQYSKLSIAHQVAAGLADFHDAYAMRDKHGEITSAAMVHADITTDQYILVDGVYKLNDFNRCRFMRRYRNSADLGGDGKPCGFSVQNNPAKNRSPEEYAYTVETEKIDIYSMGNIFYTMLTDLDPWEETNEKKAQDAVKKGIRPEVPPSIKSSTDVVDMALRKMMYKCWQHKPGDRPRARIVADYFSKKLSEFDSDKRKIE